MMIRLVVQLLFFLPVFVLNSYNNKLAAQEIPGYAFIEHADAFELMQDNDKALFIFVDTIEEYLKKHPSGAIQFSAYRFNEFPDLFNRPRPLILISNYYDIHFQQFYHHITSSGYQHVRVVEGGLTAWEQHQLPMEYGNEIEFRDMLYRVHEYSMEKKKDGDWMSLNQFTDPAFSLLKKYQDMIPREGFDKYWYEKYDLFSITTAIEMELKAPKIYKNKIWFGIGFYDGEGWRGYGGIGFYDPQSKQFGILRHPAFVRCSIREIHFSNNTLYAATYAQYELSKSFCNGVVALNLTTFNSTSIVPPFPENPEYGNEAAWMKYYDKSIEKILKDKRFIHKKVSPDFTPKTIQSIHKVGLEVFMKDSYRNEVAAQVNAVQNPVGVIDTTIVVNRQSREHIIRPHSLGPNIKVEFRLYSKLAVKPFHILTVYPWENGQISLYAPSDYVDDKLNQEENFYSITSKDEFLWTTNLFQFDLNIESYDTIFPIINVESIEPTLKEAVVRLKISELRN